MTLYQFYRSKEWERFREIVILERTGDDGILRCEYSGQPIVKKYDAIVHHKIELTEDNVNDPNIALNPDNVMVVSHKSHDTIHERCGQYTRKVYLVYGPPCAGKTTYVRNICRTDDLIIDIDAIWEALCISDRLHKPKRLTANVFGVRDALIDQVRTRTGQWRTAYYIATMPIKSERDRICDMLGAQEIYVESTLEECLDRAPDENWKGYVREWFATYRMVGE